MLKHWMMLLCYIPAAIWGLPAVLICSLLRLVGLALPPQPAGPAEARVSESSRLLAEEGNEPEGDAKVAFVTGSNTGDKSVLPLRVV